MIVHPPWRTMAEEMLKAKDPELYRELKVDGALNRHLDGLSQRARETYERIVQQLEAQNPGQGSWALQSAEELVTRDVLDPTT